MTDDLLTFLSRRLYQKKIKTDGSKLVLAFFSLLTCEQVRPNAPAVAQPFVLATSILIRVQELALNFSTQSYCWTHTKSLPKKRDSLRWRLRREVVCKYLDACWTLDHPTFSLGIFLLHLCVIVEKKKRFPGSAVDFCECSIWGEEKYRCHVKRRFFWEKRFSGCIPWFLLSLILRACINFRNITQKGTWIYKQGSTWLPFQRSLALAKGQRCIFFYGKIYLDFFVVIWNVAMWAAPKRWRSRRSGTYACEQMAASQAINERYLLIWMIGGNRNARRPHPRIFNIHHTQVKRCFFSQLRQGPRCCWNK